MEPASARNVHDGATLAHSVRGERASARVAATSTGGHAAAPMPRERSTAIAALALCAAGALFAWLLFARLGHPLFWHDESETAAFAERVLRFGFPKVHDGHSE